MNHEHRTMNKRWLSVTAFMLCAYCLLRSASSAYAAVPHLIRYQGTAVDSQGVPLEGPYNLTFRLYDAATVGTKLWEETHTAVPLSKGQFSVLLGDTTLLDAMDWTQPRWLSVQVNTDPELAPRQQITSVPLAITAEQLAGPIKTAGQNVGIGTGQPQVPLHVRGSGDLVRLESPTDSDMYLTFYGPTGRRGYVGFGSATDSRMNIWNQSNDAMYFGTNNLYRVTIDAAGNVGIGTTVPSNILSVKQNSATDPIADSWTVYPCDRQHKELLGPAPSGHLEHLKATSLYEWRRTPRATAEDIREAIGDKLPASKEAEAVKDDIIRRKTALPKFSARRVGVAIDDENVPEEILVFNPDGTKGGIDLVAYVGYLHAALKEAALKIDALEARLDAQSTR